MEKNKDHGGDVGNAEEGSVKCEWRKGGPYREDSV